MLFLDQIYILNFILCMVILSFGLFIYFMKQRLFPLFVGIAFGLFGISHIFTILGYREDLKISLLIIRYCAYLLVILSLFFLQFHHAEMDKKNKDYIDNINNINYRSLRR
jgi:hypothetical protein